MSVQFKDIRNNSAQYAANGTHEPKSSASVQYHAVKELQNLAAGDTFRGEIIAKDGENVQIQIDKNMIVLARLERSLNLAIGQNLIFEVKSNQANVLSLTPLFENLTGNNTLLKALQMAGLPMNETTQEMVVTMMEKGMNIDKNSLQSMYKQIAAMPGENTATLIEMARLKLPLTAENLEQFEHYQNFEHKLTDGIKDVFDQLPRSLLMMINSGNAKEASGLFVQLTELLGSQKTQLEGESFMERSPEGKIIIKEPQIKDGLLSGSNMEEKGLLDRNTVSAALSKETLGETKMNQVNEKNLEEGKNFYQEEGMKSNTSNIKLSSSTLNLLEQLGLKGQILDDIKQGTLPAEEWILLLGKVIKQLPPGKEELFSQLLQRPEVENILKELVQKKFFLEPAEVGQEKRVEEYYKSLQETSQKLTRAMDSMIKNDLPAGKSMQQLQNSLDFMNQLNQSFTYLQIPLKMGGKQANGELYVYTNKKNLAKKDGNVSAFLHLDMESLGAVDVRVTLLKEKVNTQFYLEKEEYLDLMEQYLPKLDERLLDKGYSSTSSVNPLRDQLSPIEQILSQEKGVSVLSKYSFDVRA